MADEAGRKFVQGPSNPFLEGNQGIVRPFIQNLPGLTQRNNLLPTLTSFAAARSRGRAEQFIAQQRARGEKTAIPSPPKDPYADLTKKYSIISGTPKSVIKRVRHVLETLRPGTIFFWDGDGAMSHEDSMRSLRLMGEEVIPAVREIGRELDLKGPFETDPQTNETIEQSDGDTAEQAAAD